MRDLYNRKNKLDYQTNRRKQIDNPLSKFMKEDIKAIFQWIDNKKYKVETIESIELL